METGKYPAWRHHASENPRLVKNAAEEAALGPGWADTPAAFTDGFAPAASVPLQPGDPTHFGPATDPPSASVVPIVPPVDDGLNDSGSLVLRDPSTEAAAIHQASASAIINMLATADEATVRRVRAFEVQHPKYAGGRKGVLKAIDEALQAFKPPTA